jgi:NADPH:quinone reductase-like Zn-dependent oxidoreductase
MPIRAPLGLTPVTFKHFIVASACDALIACQARSRFAFFQSADLDFLRGDVMQLNGKRVWITGASSGIGAATAKVLASEGAEVVLSARRTERIQSLAVEISERGGKALVRPFDVTDRASAARVGKELETLGGVDVLVNNAGIMPLAPMLDCRIDEWDKMIDINIKGLLYTIHAVLPGMSERRRGHIVNVSSVAAKFAFAGGAVYSERSSLCAASRTASGGRRSTTECMSVPLNRVRWLQRSWTA